MHAEAIERFKARIDKGEKLYYAKTRGAYDLTADESRAAEMVKHGYEEVKITEAPPEAKQDAETEAKSEADKVDSPKPKRRTRKPKADK